MIDDCSADGTRAVLERMARSDTRVRPIFLDTRHGLGRVRNPGIVLARGEFIAFIDSDDEWLPWKTEAQLEVFRQLPDVGLCWSDMSAVDADGHELYHRYLWQMYTVYQEDDVRQFFTDAVSLDHPDPPGDHFRVRFGDIYEWISWGFARQSSRPLSHGRMRGWEPSSCDTTAARGEQPC